MSVSGSARDSEPQVTAKRPGDGCALVSIILTTLNSERFLVRSIESCLGQTYSNLELVIVDGGSTDRTLEIVANCKDPRVRVIHQGDNSGKLPGALNLGMANSNGGLITWTQDDCWYETRAIEAMAKYLGARPEIGLVYTDYWFVDESGQPLSYQRVGRPEEIADGGDVVGQCFLFRRQIFDTLGPQVERHFPVHEIPWRIRLAQSFAIRPLHQALMYYTLHPDSLTGRIGPWQLRYMVADVLLQDGFWDEPQYRQRVAETHLDHAYDEYVLRGDYRRFWEHILLVARLRPALLRNRGTWKLMLSSLLPNRKTLRQKALDRWRRSEAQRQQKLQEDTLAQG